MGTIFILLASLRVLPGHQLPVAFSMTLACILPFSGREPFHLHGHLKALFRHDTFPFWPYLFSSWPGD